MEMTLTLDDKLTEALQAEGHRNGRSLKGTVRELLRRGLRKTPAREDAVAAEPFRVQAQHLGVPPEGLDFDNVGELLEHIEGPSHQ